jgi:cytochrome c-type biogenesis protein CcmE
MVRASSRGRTKFLVGIVLVVAAVVFLVYQATSQNGQYYLTIPELRAKGASLVDRPVRVEGVVQGDSIQYDAKTLDLRFTVVTDLNNPQANGGPLPVQYHGAKPDLLQNEAQAIMEGTVDAKGVFHITDENGLLLKCPTRYQQNLEQGTPAPAKMPTGS